MKPLLSVLFLLLLACNQQPESATNFNNDWQFALEGEEFQPVNLPHDWSVEFPFDSIKGEGATGYLPGGKGTYQKRFKAPAGVNYLHFDGVYNNATVMLNGEKLGFHPYGYAPFYYDITDALLPAGETNQLTVEVDHSRYADSRWYSGWCLFPTCTFRFGARLLVRPR